MALRAPYRAARQEAIWTCHEALHHGSGLEQHEALAPPFPTHNNSSRFSFRSHISFLTIYCFLGRFFGQSNISVPPSTSSLYPIFCNST